MLGTTFYHGTVRKITVAFGTLFNNIHVQRRQADGTLVNDVKVPVSYESKQKFIARLIQTNTMNENLAVETIIPRISFIMTAMTYDEDRKLNTMNNLKKMSGEDLLQQRTPMPYNFEFSVNVYTKHLDDALQIIEQILPYFHPDFNVTIIDVPEMDIRRDVAVVLNGVTAGVETDGALADRRIVNYTLDFTVKGHVYPPVRTDDGKLIRIIKNNFWTPSGDNLREDLTDLEKVTVSVDPLGTCSDPLILNEADCITAGKDWTDTEEDDTWEPKIIIE